MIDDSLPSTSLSASSIKHSQALGASSHRNANPADRRLNLATMSCSDDSFCNLDFASEELPQSGSAAEMGHDDGDGSSSTHRIPLSKETKDVIPVSNSIERGGANSSWDSQLLPILTESSLSNVRAWSNVELQGNTVFPHSHWTNASQVWNGSPPHPRQYELIPAGHLLIGEDQHQIRSYLCNTRTQGCMNQQNCTYQSKNTHGMTMYQNHERSMHQNHHQQLFAPTRSLNHQSYGQAQFYHTLPQQIQHSLHGSTPYQSTAHVPMTLYMPCDDDALSEYQCLVRKQIEFFAASSDDIGVNVQGRNRAVVLGQVGVRCKHCNFVPTRRKSRGAVYYPAALVGVYQAAQNMAKGHLSESCEHIPKELGEQLLTSQKQKSVGGGKAYWARAARVLGVYEDGNVLRFSPT